MEWIVGGLVILSIAWIGDRKNARENPVGNYVNRVPPESLGTMGIIIFITLAGLVLGGEFVSNLLKWL